MYYNATLLGVDVNEISDISEENVKFFHQILKSKYKTPCYLFYANIDSNCTGIPSRLSNKIIEAIILLEKIIKREDHNIEYRFTVDRYYRDIDADQLTLVVVFNSFPSTQTDPIFMLEDLDNINCFLDIKKIENYLIEYFENLADRDMIYKINENTTSKNVLSLFQNTAIDRNEEIIYNNIVEAVQRGEHRCRVLDCKDEEYFSKSVFKTLLRWNICLNVRCSGIYADWGKSIESKKGVILLQMKEEEEITIDELAEYVEKLGLCVVD